MIGVILVCTVAGIAIYFGIVRPLLPTEWHLARSVRYGKAYRPNLCKTVM